MQDDEVRIERTEEKDPPHFPSLREQLAKAGEGKHLF